MSFYLVRLRHLVLFSTLSISCPHLFLMGCLLMRYNMVSQPHMKIFILLAFVFFLIYEIMFFISLPLVVLIVFLGYRISPKVFRCLDPIIQLKCLACAQLFYSKSVSIPMIVFQWLTSDGDSFSDPTLYCSMVATLQYLTITHPDLAHAVNFVSQYM